MNPVRLLTLLSALVGCVTSAAAAPASDAIVAMLVAETLHNPTASGATLAMVPAEDCELFVDYGEDPAERRRTPTIAVQAGQLATFVLDGAPPGAEVAYRVSARRPGRPWSTRREHGFRTLRPPGSTFSFAVMGDTHAWAVWSRRFCTPRPGNSEFGPLAQTFANLRADPSLDFVVGGSDHAMTACSACVGCEMSDGTIVSSGDADDPRDALMRYRTLFSRELYGSFGADLPLLFIKGDHDGEKGWAGSGETCGQSALLATWSEDARRAHVPTAHAAYGAERGGDESGSYYALETGDLLLVVLDPIRYTPQAPVEPDSWTLGETQLAWLDRTLGESSATFKVVFAEHVLGGNNDPGFGCWKGRGALRATTTGEVNGPFAGEQFVVHELLKRHDAQVFFTFQDHVVVWGEKVDEDFVGEGVTYVTGGRSSGIGANWANLDWYKAAMDYDGDGVPEYQTEVTGTRKPGHFKVTVHGAERLEFEYLQAMPNAKKILGFVIEP